MSSIPLLKAAGLNRSSNEISSVPEGANTEAKNIVIRSKDLSEPRRGIGNANSGSVQDAVRAILSYGSELYAWNGPLIDTVPDGGVAQFNGTSALVPTATWMGALPTDSFSDTARNGPGYLRPRGFEAKNALYYTSYFGVYKADSVALADDSRLAGIPKPLGFYSALTSLSATPADNWLADGDWTAYTYLFGTRDATGRTILGEPSSRVTLQNTSGAAARVLLTLGCPSAFSPTYNFVQVYRAATAATENQLTGDYYQVGEFPLASAAVTSRSFTFLDNTPEGATNNGGLGRLGYFSANSEGVAEANTEPPNAVDATYYQSRAVYANTATRHKLPLDILGVDPGSTGNGGLKPGDKIILDGFTYTAAASQNIPAREFEVATGGGSNAYLAIYETARNLALCINLGPTLGAPSGLYAYQTAEDTGSPGSLIIERQGVEYVSFNANAESAAAASLTCFNPLLPTLASGNVVSSSNEAGPNRIYYSKRDIPEAVPSKNYVTVGAENKKILRIVTLRDRLFIFKEDGVFALSGDMSNCRIYPLDPTARLVAPDSLALVSNQIFGLTTMGVVAVSDSGATIVSKGIERELAHYINAGGSASSNLYLGTWACGYESERLYLLGVASTSPYYCDRIYVYNSASAAWSWWDVQATCGIVHPVTDKLHLGGTENDNFLAERKSLTNNDYHDDETAAVIDTATASGSIAFTTAVAPVVGDLVYQASSGAYGHVTAATSMACTVTPHGTFTPGACRIYRGYEAAIEWAAKAAGGIDASAHVREIEVSLRDANFGTAYAGMSTNVTTTPYYRPVVFPASGAFVPSAPVTWGQDVFPSDKRVGVDQEVSRAKFYRARFYTREANAMWSLQGLTLLGDKTSERGGK